MAVGRVVAYLGRETVRVVLADGHEVTAVLVGLARRLVKPIAEGDDVHVRMGASGRYEIASRYYDGATDTWTREALIRQGVLRSAGMPDEIAGKHGRVLRLDDEGRRIAAERVAVGGVDESDPKTWGFRR